MANLPAFSTPPLFYAPCFPLSLRKLGKEVPDSRIEERVEAQKPGQCCSLIYTSGTTGPPKAVMISHDNITWTAEVMRTLWLSVCRRTFLRRDIPLWFLTSHGGVRVSWPHFDQSPMPTSRLNHDQLHQRCRPCGQAPKRVCFFLFSCPLADPLSPKGVPPHSCALLPLLITSLLDAMRAPTRPESRESVSYLGDDCVAFTTPYSCFSRTLIPNPTLVCSSSAGVG